MLSGVVSTIFIVRRQRYDRTRKKRGAALSPAVSQAIGKEWRALVVPLALQEGAQGRGKAGAQRPS